MFIAVCNSYHKLRNSSADSEITNISSSKFTTCMSIFIAVFKVLRLLQILYMFLNVTSYTLTCLPSSEKSFLTLPESSLTASVMSVRTWSNERAVLRLSRTRTARRGRLPLRITVMRRGFTNVDWSPWSTSSAPPANVDSVAFAEHGLPEPLLPEPLIVAPLLLLGCRTL